MIIFALILFLITFYLIKIIKKRIKLKKFFKAYIQSLNKLKNFKENNIPLENILNDISFSGTKLILRILIIFIPYLANYFIFSFLGLSFIIVILLASIPYLYFIF